MSDFTPGPWEVREYVDAYTVVDSRGFQIEDTPMSILDDYTEKGYRHWADAPGVTYIERPLPERGANARLIAAAPELVAALEAMTQYAASITSECPPECHCDVAEARALLARIKGESNE